MIDHTIAATRNSQPAHRAPAPKRESIISRVILLLWVILFVLVVGAAWWLYVYRPEVFASWRERFATLTQEEKLDSQQVDQDAADLFVPRSEQIVPDIRPPVIGGQDVDDAPVESVKETEQSDGRDASGSVLFNQPSPPTDPSQNRETFPAKSMDQPSATASQPNSARVPARPPSDSDSASAPSISSSTTTATDSATESIPKHKHTHPNTAPRNTSTRKPRPHESFGDTSRPNADSTVPEVTTETNRNTPTPITGTNVDAPKPALDAPTNDAQILDEPSGLEALDAALASNPVNPIRRKSGLVIIVNKANRRNLSKSDIRNIYRDRITRWPSGDQILVLDLPLESAERQIFSSAILNMSALDAATETSNAIITNRMQNEHRVKNPRVIVSYVERHQNAIGYIPAEALDEDDDVRVAYSIP